MSVEDKICAFNVNEVHLVAMILPYIYEAMNEGKKISTFFENDVNEIYEKISNVSERFWKNKEKLDKIDWNKTEISDLSKKFTKEADIVIVAGKKDFIERINRLVINFHTKFTLVNCFQIDDFNDNLQSIVKNYQKILTTRGLRDIKELYAV